MFISNGWQRPEGLCKSAWETMSPFVMGVAQGQRKSGASCACVDTRPSMAVETEGFYDGWMKNPRSAMIFCNDGFRPVSVLLEAMDEYDAP